MTGYGLNSGEMGAVANKINGIHDRVTDNATDLRKTNIEAKDFGRAHTQAGSPFTDLVTKLGKLVTAEATAMRNYSALLRESHNEYDAAEWANSDIFTKTSGV